MPSTLHDAPLLLLRSEPSLLTWLLARSVGFVVPDDAVARVAEADFSQPVSFVRQADAVVVLEQAGRAIDGFVVEVQLEIKPEKRFAWPLYLATLHARLQCRCRLVVIAADERVARWAAEPIDSMQPDSPLIPLVLGPAEIPAITDPDEARERPELATLGALVHGRGPLGPAAIKATLHALSAMDAEHAATYTDLIVTTLADVVNRLQEDPMPLFGYELQSEMMRKPYEAGRAEGVELGRAEAAEIARLQSAARLQTAILDVLAARGIALSAEARRRITESTDADTLQRWIVRAAVAPLDDDLWRE